MNVGLVLAAAAAGGVGRGAAVPRRSWRSCGGRREAFPLGILIVNVSGSFALGIVVGLGAAIAPPAVVAGASEPACSAGYTTFSTVSVETVLLFQRKRRRAAIVNVVGTLALALAAAALGGCRRHALASLAGG